MPFGTRDISATKTISIRCIIVIERLRSSRLIKTRFGVRAYVKLRRTGDAETRNHCGGYRHGVRLGVLVKRIWEAFGIGHRDRDPAWPARPAAHTSRPRTGGRHARPVVTDEPRRARRDLPPGSSVGDSRGTHPGHGHPVAGNPADASPLSRCAADVAGQGRSSRASRAPSTASSACAWSGARCTRGRAGSTASRRWCSITARPR